MYVCALISEIYYPYPYCVGHGKFARHKSRVQIRHISELLLVYSTYVLYSRGPTPDFSGDVVAHC